MASPKRFADRDEIADVRVEAEKVERGEEAGELRRVAGRVMARRDMGKLVYLDLLVNEETRADFELRTRMVTAIRRYLDEHGFLEVETPILQPRYGGALAEPFVTHSNELDTDLYLRIASELYLKRLIVGGLEKVYELAKDFRNESISYKHSPEFTQVEWYEAYADYRDTMERTEALVFRAAEVVGATTVTFRGLDIDLSPPWQRVKFIEALESKGIWSRDE